MNYLTLWYFSKYRNFWVVSGDTAQNPVIPVYEGSSKAALRFFKYCHFVKLDQYRFYPTGINPNHNKKAEPYKVDQDFLDRLGVLVYLKGQPSTLKSTEKKQKLVASEAIKQSLKTQESININDLRSEYSEVEIKLALKKLSALLIIENEVIMSKK